MFLLTQSTVCRGFSVVLDPIGRLRGLGGTVGSNCEGFEDNEGGIIGLMFLRQGAYRH